ncbi:hypothetical protein SDC9_183331 [bioreactor metagenome]|uniref:Uncharacterized protein n=1 Tax=bioreactor metagenome TaxID=1076179 RepID=A0A645HCH7_9ZZZZ
MCGQVGHNRFVLRVPPLGIQRLAGFGGSLDLAFNGLSAGLQVLRCGYAVAVQVKELLFVAVKAYDILPQQKSRLIRQLAALYFSQQVQVLEI